MEQQGWSGTKKLVVFGCGGLVLIALVCAGLGGLVFVRAKQEVDKISDMTDAERAAYLGDKLSGLSAEYDPTVDLFLKKLGDGEIAGAYAMTSTEFQAQTSQEELGEIQAKIERYLGAYQARHVSGVNRQMGTNPHVTLKYYGVYANGDGTLEVVLVADPSDPSGKSYLVQSFSVNSPLFDQPPPDSSVEDDDTDEIEPK